METILLAGGAAFDLDHMHGLVSADLHPEVQDKVAGIRHLMLKDKARFVAQIQACDEEADADTRDDLRRLKNLPAAFVEGLANGSLRFLIVTFDPGQRPALQAAIDAFVDAGLVQFECTSDDRVVVAGKRAS